ncbi:hypothetical protein Bca4012_069838 [Brassica carinata]
MNSDDRHLSPPIRRRHNPCLLVGRSVGEVWMLSVFQPSSTPPPHQPGHNCATPIETDPNSPINSNTMHGTFNHIFFDQNSSTLSQLL